jgi:hypothetical protein
MPGPTAFGRKAIQAIGKGAFKLGSKKAASRILGKIAVGSKEWRKAFEHIALHFAPMEGKTVHAVFKETYRSEAGVAKLIREAITRLGRAPVAGEGSTYILEKEFKQAIGTVKIGDKVHDCKILRIIVDYTGKPLSAYPVKDFTAAAGAFVAFTSSSSQADVPRVAAVEDTYAAEYALSERTRENVSRSRVYGDGLVGTIVEVLDMLTFDSTSIGLDPQEVISAGQVEARANAAIQMIEAKLGRSLDKTTQEQVRKDVRQIWGYGAAND